MLSDSHFMMRRFCGNAHGMEREDDLFPEFCCKVRGRRVEIACVVMGREVHAAVFALQKEKFYLWTGIIGISLRAGTLCRLFQYPARVAREGLLFLIDVAEHPAGFGRARRPR